MLYEGVSGYAVINTKNDGVCFESEDLEICKRYCDKGKVIVKVTPKKNGFWLKVSYHKLYPWFAKFNGELFLFKLCFTWAKVFCKEYGKEIVWKPEDDGTVFA